MVGSDVPGAAKLADFFGSSERHVTPELTEILEVIATTGKVWHDWNHLKALLGVRMDEVLDTYNKRRLAVDVGPPRPLLGGESFEDLQKRLHSLLEAISGPPFTIQRLCEVLLWPHEMYTTIDKLALAIEKLLTVTQTVAPSSDAYPPLPLPPHQPPPPRRPHPQQNQPRLSFGHQPHPEANPDQMEEHELNLHQHNQVHPRGPVDGATPLPSFLEGEKSSFVPEGGVQKAFMPQGGANDVRPSFLDAASSEMLEGGGKEEGNKRSFEEASAHQTEFANHLQVGDIISGNPPNASEMDTANGDTGNSQLGANEDVPHGSSGDTLNRDTLHVPLDQGRSVEVAMQSMQEPSIEPMTPPSTVDNTARAEPVVQQPIQGQTSDGHPAVNAHSALQPVLGGQVEGAQKEKGGSLLDERPAVVSETAQQGNRMEEG